MEWSVACYKRISPEISCSIFFFIFQSTSGVSVNPEVQRTFQRLSEGKELRYIIFKIEVFGFYFIFITLQASSTRPFEGYIKNTAHFIALRTLVMWQAIWRLFHIAVEYVLWWSSISRRGVKTFLKLGNEFGANMASWWGSRLLKSSLKRLLLEILSFTNCLLVKRYSRGLPS